MAQTPQDFRPTPAHFWGVPHAAILTKQAMFTLAKLHSELAGKVIENKKEARRLTVSRLQVEAIMKLLEPGYSVRAISIRRRKLNALVHEGHGIPGSPGRTADG
jgi:hypothetical protein